MSIIVVVNTQMIIFVVSFFGHTLSNVFINAEPNGKMDNAASSTIYTPTTSSEEREFMTYTYLMSFYCLKNFNLCAILQI